MRQAVDNGEAFPRATRANLAWTKRSGVNPSPRTFLFPNRFPVAKQLSQEEPGVVRTQLGLNAALITERESKGWITAIMKLAELALAEQEAILSGATRSQPHHNKLTGSVSRDRISSTLALFRGRTSDFIEHTSDAAEKRIGSSHAQIGGYLGSAG